MMYATPTSTRPMVVLVGATITAAATMLDRYALDARTDVVVLRSERRRVSWQDDLADFLEEAKLDRKMRYREDRLAVAARRAHFGGRPALAERLYIRPKRTGRACGGRHRVML